jgi:hypothetical protein
LTLAAVTEPGAYKATAAITWDITGRGAAGGVLAPLHTTAAAAFRVAESLSSTPAAEHEASRVLAPA